MFQYIMFFILLSPIFLKSSDSAPTNAASSNLAPSAKAASDAEFRAVDPKAPAPELFMPAPLPKITVSGSTNDDDAADKKQHRNRSRSLASISGFSPSLPGEKDFESDIFTALAACSVIAHRRNSRFSPKNNPEERKKKSLSSSERSLTAQAAEAAGSNASSASDMDEMDHQLSANEALKEAERELERLSGEHKRLPRARDAAKSAGKNLSAFVFPQK